MQNLDIDQCKAIAQAQAAGNDFFVFGGKVWDISEEDARECAKAWALDKTYINTLTDGQLTEWLESEACELEYESDGDYMVLDDSEANEKAAEYIKESLWAFNASFLSDVTSFDVSIFEAIQANDKCEDNNDVMVQLIGGNMQDLIDQAISSDGRGHLLNTYDGSESEFNCFDYTGENTHLYVYRMN